MSVECISGKHERLLTLNVASAFFFCCTEGCCGPVRYRHVNVNGLIYLDSDGGSIN